MWVPTGITPKSRENIKSSGASSAEMCAVTKRCEAVCSEHCDCF